MTSTDTTPDAHILLLTLKKGADAKAVRAACEHFGWKFRAHRLIVLSFDLGRPVTAEDTARAETVAGVRGAYANATRSLDD